MHFGIDVQGNHPFGRRADASTVRAPREHLVRHADDLPSLNVSAFHTGGERDRPFFVLLGLQRPYAVANGFALDRATEARDVEHAVAKRAD